MSASALSKRARTFQVRVETRQAELGEMQRINEERIKKQIEEWQEEQEKRWKREEVHWAEQWTEHDRVHAPWARAWRRLSRPCRNTRVS